MRRNASRSLPYAVVIAAGLVVAGCGKSPPRPTDRAEAVVETALDAWSRGESADQFAGPDGPVQVSDPDWKEGYRLLSFLSAGAEPSPDTPDHIRCRVSLSLQDSKGRKADKEVVYDVQLGEKNVIRRVPR